MGVAVTMDPVIRELSRLDEIAREAGRIARSEREGVVRELKSDGSIVTNGDRAVERFLRSVLPVEWPGTNVWGEEFGHEPPGENGLWVLDPVDGTSNYSFGSPLWGVSIGLVSGAGHLCLGAIDLPDLRETYLTGLGHGAMVNGEPLPPIPPGPIEPWELVSYGEWILERYGSAALPGKMRYSGAFVIDGTFVARQRYRAMIGGTESLYDAAPAILMARELGAIVRYTDGAPLIEADLLGGGRIPGPWTILPSGADLHLDR